MSEEPRPTPRPRRPADPGEAAAAERAAPVRPSRPSSASRGRSRPAGRRRSSSAGRGPALRTEAEADALKRAGLIIAVGVVAIVVLVGVVLDQPAAAVGGSIGWVIAMAWTFRKDHPGRAA
ncbi:MAG: hypothetical protein JWO77_3213 [Ilumatobacteraceae bacterium]|nr:hypothetical protein [Ilumatobacteraceae bacterium]